MSGCFVSMYVSRLGLEEKSVTCVMRDEDKGKEVKCDIYIGDTAMKLGMKGDE